MRVEGVLFGIYFVFFSVVSTVYWYLSGDPAGTVMIALVGGLSFIIGYYLLFTSRRMEARPEDRPDAEISEGSGEMGFFSPHSWWPIAMAASFATTGLGMAFGVWLILIGGAALLVTTFGLLFEYYVGINRSQSMTLQTLQSVGEAPTSTHKFLGD